MRSFLFRLHLREWALRRLGYSILEKMTCAKKVVRCVIVTKEGKAYFGENNCLNPQEKCPREPGEGYEKCTSICQQTGHAEINALKRASVDNLGGATAYLIGHHHYCRACQLALFSAGVKYLTAPTE